MTPRVLLDAGPLVAVLNQRDQDHTWALGQLDSFPRPMLTCESVISEACYLLRHTPTGIHDVLEAVRLKMLEIPFRLHEHIEEVARLMGKYADLPMSLSDACLVRMSEIFDDSLVLTTDGDFLVYRRHGRDVIPTVMPPRMK